MGTQKQYKKRKIILCFKIDPYRPKRLQNTTPPTQASCLVTLRCSLKRPRSGGSMPKVVKMKQTPKGQKVSGFLLESLGCE